MRPRRNGYLRRAAKAVAGPAESMQKGFAGTSDSLAEYLAKM
jgi:hypothetical protein